MPRKAVKTDPGHGHNPDHNHGADADVSTQVQSKAAKSGATLTNVAAYDDNGKPTHYLAEGMSPAWDQYPELVGLEFDQLVAKRVDLKSEIDFRTAKLKDLDVEIQSQMAVAGTEKVSWEGRPVQVVHSRSGSKIVAEKLLLAGVAASTIAGATEEGKPYSYLLVGRPTK